MPLTLSHLTDHDPAAQALLKAMDVPATLSGLTHALALVLRALAHAARDSERVAQWHAVAERVRVRIAQHKTPEDDPQLNSSALPAALPYRGLLTAAVSRRWPDTHPMLLATLAWAVCRAAGTSSVLSKDFGEQLRQCVLATERPRQSDWKRLVDDFPTDIASAQAVAARLQSEVAHKFCRALQELFARDIPPPPEGNARPFGPTTVPEAAAHRLTRSGATSDSAAAEAGASEAEAPPPGPSGPGAADHGPPSIANRVHEAHVAPWGAKLGAPRLWNSLTPQATRTITRALHGELQGAPAVAQQATLLLLSLLVGASPKLTLRVPVTRADGPPATGDLWLHVTPQASFLQWSFAAVRGALRTPTPADTSAHTTEAAGDPEHGSGPTTPLADINPDLDPDNNIHNQADEPDDDEALSVDDPGADRICIPLPARLSEALAVALERAPQAATIAELIAWGDQPLRPVHHHLLTLGDRAHAAEPARFAASLPAVYLQVCGSDMVAALCTARFELVPVSALFYFHPQPRWLGDQVARVYGWLGLSEPVVPVAGPQAPSTALPTRDALHHGWQMLQTEIEQAVQRLQAQRPASEHVPAANHLLELLCASFVLHSGARGSQLGRIRWHQVPSPSHWVLVHDKATDGPRSARLIGKTAVLDQILALVAHALRRVGLITKGGHGLAPDDWVFPVLSVDSTEARAEQPLRTPAVAAHLQRLFGARVNVGRHAWITALAEDGVDRWLIRTLSGHGSFLTRAHHAASLVSAREAALCLSEAMDQASARLWGDSAVLARLVQLVGQVPPRVGSAGLHIAPDVMALLREAGRARSVPARASQCAPSWSVTTLAGWQITQQWRTVLLEGSAPVAAPLRFFLSLVLVDGLPLPVALAMAAEPQTVPRVGTALGAMWSRPHFVHPVWQPMQPASVIAWQAARHAAQHAAGLSQGRLREEAVRWLRMHWPAPAATLENASPDALLVLLGRCVQHWMSVELPVLAGVMAHDGLDTPVLSALSLARLAGEPVVSNLAWTEQALDEDEPPPSSRQRFGALSRAINLPKDRPIGQDIAQARMVLSRLDGVDPGADGPLACCHAWMTLEMEMILSAHPHANAVSSSATRWSALHPLWNDVATDETPWEWTQSWTQRVSAWLTSAEATAGQAACAPDSTHGPSGGTDEQHRPSGARGMEPMRVKDALTRMLSTLRRHGWAIPAQAFKVLGKPVDEVPRNSAASSLPLDEDLSGWHEQVAQHYADRPLEQTLGSLRVQLAQAAPLRAGELLALPLHCVSDHDELVLAPNAWSADKTDHARRLIPLARRHAQAIERAREQVKQAVPQAKWLFRASERLSQRMPRLCARVDRLLRQRMHDRDARFHALRARALMNEVWPGWMALAQRWLTGGVSQASAQAWLGQCETAQRWTHAVSSALMAGHGSIDAATLHYFSNWPWIKSLHLRALLDEPRGAAWFDAAGLNTAAYRQVRSRARRAQAPVPDAWVWLVQHVSRQVADAPRLYELQHSAGTPPSAQGWPPASPEDAPDAAPPVTPGDGGRWHGLRLRYVGLRMLEVSEARAQHLSNLRSSELPALERALQRHAWAVGLVRKRSRGDGSGRARAADERLLMSPEGDLIQAWISRMAGDTLTFFRVVLLRLGAERQGLGREIWDDGMWADIVRDMPPGLCLTLRFGRGAHLSMTHHHRLDALKPALLLGDRARDAGRIPFVTLGRPQGNDVIAARLTSVLRVWVLACFALNFDSSTKET